MHKLLAGCMLALGAAGIAATAAAADYPDRSIRLIVPTSPGSTADVVARVVADSMSKTLGQTLVVENLSGAAGVPGTRQLVAAKPDGYTLAIVSSNHAINPSLHKSLPYDSVKDITPISIIGTTPLVMVVAENSPYRTVQDLLKAAREQPGTINYGSAGTGSVLHLAGEMLKAKAKADMVHIPYRGGSALATDVMSGQIHTAFLAVPSVLGQIKAGKLRALAVSTPKRLDALPDVPSLSEAGVKDYAYDAWIALIGPAGLPGDVVRELQAATAKAMKDETVLKALAPQGFVSNGSSADEARSTIVDEIARSAELVKAAGIQPQQ
ncbi:Bug family tripartite tricarboxylate transporter substrate binding protein [Pollutimonas sp. M17]|uniref:Bug family tripartite tricarboxylate transporter substrate binding protein n=1 Tax=Pollutimonas sp. M17 TaxID=2962065 RepID=UPI0021F44C0B|nr:tripartite tricarboxylate transporter substrate binding protein [Pollutimonas sp. M17]UYO93179.1 tripartite tricarboxylate transporter substrate binding protein [Pollutimonas sp. M17]